MTISRAARGLLALAIFLVATLVDTTAGHAQGSRAGHAHARVADALEHLKDPMLDLAIQADNAGADAIGDLTLGITIGSAVRSRTAYEKSLTAGPELTIFAATLPEKDAVEAGRTRRFRTSVDLRRSAASVGPTRWSTPCGSIFGPPACRSPSSTRRSSSWSERRGPAPGLDDDRADRTPALDPDGRLVDAAFEASIAPGGSLSAQVAALDRLASGTRVGPIDLVIRPSLLDQLSRMADIRSRDGGAVEEQRGRCRPRRRDPRRAPSHRLLGAHPHVGGCRSPHRRSRRSASGSPRT